MYSFHYLSVRANAKDQGNLVSRFLFMTLTYFFGEFVMESYICRELFQINVQLILLLSVSAIPYEGNVIL